MTMSQYGYGSGGYLTRFEDYYKSSSDESGDEDDAKTSVPNPAVAPSVEVKQEDASQHYYSESEDEEVSNPLENVSAHVEVQSQQQNGEFAPPSKDWVPHALNDLKMTIKPPKDFKGYQEGAYPEDVEDQQCDDDEDKNFSNDYADVCKFRCSLCDRAFNQRSNAVTHYKNIHLIANLQMHLH